MTESRNLIYYSGNSNGNLPSGGYTLGKWLIYWAWLYFINVIEISEYLQSFDFVTKDMPGALESYEWNQLFNYTKLLRLNND